MKRKEVQPNQLNLVLGTWGKVPSCGDFLKDKNKESRSKIVGRQVGHNLSNFGEKIIG